MKARVARDVRRIPLRCVQAAIFFLFYGGYARDTKEAVNSILKFAALCRGDKAAGILKEDRDAPLEQARGFIPRAPSDRFNNNTHMRLPIRGQAGLCWNLHEATGTY